jgi:hypothetical protein
MWIKGNASCYVSAVAVGVIVEVRVLFRIAGSTCRRAGAIDPGCEQHRTLIPPHLCRLQLAFAGDARIIDGSVARNSP